MLHKKIRQEHGILEDFHKLLNAIALISQVQRIIPGRISRKQSGSSAIYFTCSYETSTGWKFKMSKGSTSQELFIVCKEEEKGIVKESITNLIQEYI